MTERARTPAHVAAAETSAARFVARQLHKRPASEACLVTAQNELNAKMAEWSEALSMKAEEILRDMIKEL
jgi:hypothetical protein